MTPLVLVVALGAFVHPHSSRDVRPAIVTRRVEPPSAAHPVREFVRHCVNPEVPAPTSELTEAVILIGLILLQVLLCPCCRMVLAMPGKLASTVASTVLGRLRGGATDEALLHLAKTVRMCAVVGMFCAVYRVVGEDAIARFWKENGFILKMFLLFLLLDMPAKVASTVASTVLGRLRGGATDEALLHLGKTVRMCAVFGMFCAVPLLNETGLNLVMMLLFFLPVMITWITRKSTVYRVVGEDAIAKFWKEIGIGLSVFLLLIFSRVIRQILSVFLGMIQRQPK